MTTRQLVVTHCVFPSHQTRDTASALILYWTNVNEVGPILNQCCTKMLFLLGLANHNFHGLGYSVTSICRTIYHCIEYKVKNECDSDIYGYLYTFL